MAANLISLFDDLTLHHVPLPEDLDGFIALLQRGYRLPHSGLAALSQEATLVHTLWQAWHQQQTDEGRRDRLAVYLEQLAASLQRLPREENLYWAGLTQLSPPEAHWARALMGRGQLTMLLHGGLPRELSDEDAHPATPLRELISALGIALPADTSLSRHALETAPSLPARESGGRMAQQMDLLARPTVAAAEDVTQKHGSAAPVNYGGFLDTVFAPLDNGEHFAARARAYADNVPDSPARRRLQVYAGADPEQEARAVDVQIRRWLLEGKSRIGVVTEDRRLARRLRALLERADVTLHDAGGWALSTTRAAAALERWLQTVEEDFAYQPFTDLLKSAFVFPQRDRAALHQAVYRFEQDIVQRENVGRDLARYRKHLQFRRQRWPQAQGEAVAALLDDVEYAAAPLLAHARVARRTRPEVLLAALQESLARLGMQEAYANDAAGSRLLQELEAMNRALPGRSLAMTWLEFRAWLGRTLERYNFQPPTPPTPVQLLGLEQSALAHFDALIIAGAGAAHLPGAGEPTPFFNDGVRRELGLPGARLRYLRRLHHFRRLLEAAPHVLLTHHILANGDEVPASPWLLALQSFHRLAYSDDLAANELTRLVDAPAAQVFRADTRAYPQPRSAPSPALPRTLVPERISTSAYQSLMDCPYQFYAARALGLSAPEAVREALEKSDYGERVHLALQAFHSDVPHLPGPYAHALSEAQRDLAIACLQAISRAVFAADLEDNFEHRGWYKRWEAMIPAYIDWQIERERQWRVVRVEALAERELAPGVVMHGRLDRIDRGAAGHAVIDYKTGIVPRDDAVLNGEAVQLPCYALLDPEPVAQVEYLSVDGQKVKSRAALGENELSQLSADVGKRLVTLMTALREGSALPAWGDEQTCTYCAMAGVCRRQAWSEDSPPHN